jgi:hypothetical protein
MSNEDKKLIEGFGKKLVNSFTAMDFTVFKTAWSDQLFKDRLKSLNEVQTAVFDNFYEESLKLSIKVQNSELINRIMELNGSAHLTRTDHFASHSELTLLFIYGGTYDFLKYRVELLGNKVKISDYYNYKEEAWFSESIIQMALLNSKFRAGSEERTLVNTTIMYSDRALAKGDIETALEVLNDIPVKIFKGNYLSFKKLNIAAQLDADVFTSVLQKEYESNKSPYIKYMYGLYLDSSEFIIIEKQLAIQTNSKIALDTLNENGYLWGIRNGW